MQRRQLKSRGENSEIRDTPSRLNERRANLFQDVRTMADPNVIVGVIQSFQGPEEEPLSEMSSRSIGDVLPRDHDVWLRFEGSERRARLDQTDPRAWLYASIAQDLHDNKRPIFVEVAPDLESRRAVTHMSAPMVVRVKRIRLLSSGRVEVFFQPSVAPYTLVTSHPNYGEMLDLLNEAKRVESFVLVVSQQRFREISYVGRADTTFEPFGGVHKAPKVPDILKSEGEIIATLEPVNLNRALDLFRKMREMGCDSAGTGACTPFNYPDDGCHARAHHMCEVMLKKENVRSAKVWLYGSGASADRNTLNPETANHPHCAVVWRYHVAPVLRVEVQGSQVWRVIDPSLFDSQGGLPSPTDWKDRQRDADAHFIFTEAGVYDQFDEGVVQSGDWDPQFARVPSGLVEYRQYLRSRIDWCGPPPYC
jgi:Glutaminase